MRYVPGLVLAGSTLAGYRGNTCLGRNEELAALSNKSKSSRTYILSILETLLGNVEGIVGRLGTRGLSSLK